MWGHSPTCGCAIYRCFPRLFYLFQLGSSQQGFDTFAIINLRILEAELRDELSRLGPPPAVPEGLAAPPAPPAPAGTPSAETRREGLTTPQKAEEEAKQSLTPKYPPPRPPPQRAPEPNNNSVSSQEPPEEEKAPATPGVTDLTKNPEPGEASSSHQRVREPGHSSSKEKRRSPRDKREEKRSRKSDSRGGKRRREENSLERERERGRERKHRSERPPEPQDPPPRQRDGNDWGLQQTQTSTPTRPWVEGTRAEFGPSKVEGVHEQRRGRESEARDLY